MFYVWGIGTTYKFEGGHNSINNSNPNETAILCPTQLRLALKCHTKLRQLLCSKSLDQDQG